MDIRIICNNEHAKAIKELCDRHEIGGARIYEMRGDRYRKRVYLNVDDLRADRLLQNLTMLKVAGETKALQAPRKERGRNVEHS